MVQMADASRDGAGPFLFLEPEEMVLAVLLELSNISGVFPLKRGKRVWWFSGTDTQMPPRVASFCRKERTWIVLPVRCARLCAGSLGQASMHDRESRSMLLDSLEATEQAAPRPVVLAGKDSCGQGVGSP
jgi:hypothetical protein